jgi:hypothetical protein
MPPTPDATTLPAAEPTPQDQGNTAAAGPQPSQAATDTAAATPTPATAPAAPAAPSAPAAAAPAQPSQLSAGDRTKHVLGDIFQTLAGGQKVVYQKGPNGEPIKTYQDLKPGEMARGILAAAMTGLVGGFSAPRGSGKAGTVAAGAAAEDKARTAQAAGQERQAQTEFANQNVADELLMKKARAAQEQQESILNMQKTHQIMSEAAEKARQEGIIFTQQQQEHLQAQDNKYYASRAAGGQAIQDPKNPGQELVLHTMDEANRYIADHADLLLAPGSFDTRPFQRPGVGGWVVMKTPLAAEEKRDVYFAKRDDKGKLLTDKDGQYIPSGQRDQSGNIIQPGEMTGKEYQNKMTEVIAYREATAKWQDSLAQAEERRALALKDESIVAANKQLTDAGNDPTAIDINTGLPKMPFKSRMALGAFYLQNSRAAEANIAKMQTAYESEDPKSDEAKALRASIEKTQDEDDQYKKAIVAMNAKTTLPQSMATSLLNEFDNDPKKASEFFEKQVAAGKYRSSLRTDEVASVRKTLADVSVAQQQKKAEEKPAEEEYGKSSDTSKIVTPAAAQQAQAIILQHLSSGTTLDDIMQNIKTDETLSRADKAKLISGLPKQAPGKILMVSPEGSIQNAAPADQKQLEAAGYRAINQKPNPAPGAVYDLTSPEQKPNPAAPFGR